MKFVKSAVLVGVGLAIGIALVPQAAEAAVNYFDQTKIVTGTGMASCPSGYKVTGGGFKAVPKNSYGSTSSNEYEVTSSYPASSTKWIVTVTKISGKYNSGSGMWTYLTSSYNAPVYAVCTK